MKYNYLTQEIKSVQKGSDVYGLVEKIAYFLWEKDNLPTETNYLFAQYILTEWANKRSYFHLEELHNILNYYAFQYYKSDPISSPFDHWMKAQNRFAEQILSEEY